MASPTYSLHALVLRKTKLSETDLIITLLAEDGSLVRGVAKGARKPNNTFASRLELFSDVNLLMVQTKSLHIISEVQVNCARAFLRNDVIRAAAGECALELFCALAQEDLPGNRLFALAEAYFDALESSTDEQVPYVVAAELLKAMGVSGFAPGFDACLFCGTPREHMQDERIFYSFGEGGPVCVRCAAQTTASPTTHEVLSCASFLLHSPFSAIASLTPTRACASGLLQFCGRFIEAHCQITLKSLSFLQTVTIPLIFSCETETSPLQ